MVATLTGTGIGRSVNVTPATPLSASRVASDAALRPKGGKRKAEKPQRTHAAPKAGRRAKRASDDATVLLVNAADAAAYLSQRSDFWDATQVLAHPEVARMALTEALEDLASEEANIGHTRFSRKNQQATAVIKSQVSVLIDAALMLDEVHQANLVRGD
jgi:hypothetical protein